MEKLLKNSLLNAILVVLIFTLSSCSQTKDPVDTESFPKTVTTEGKLEIEVLGGSDLREVPVLNEIISVIRIINNTNRDQILIIDPEFSEFKLLGSDNPNSKGVNCLDINEQLDVGEICFLTVSFIAPDRNFYAEILNVNDQTIVYKAQGKAVSNITVEWADNVDNNGHNFGQILVGGQRETKFSIINVGSELTTYDLQLNTSSPYIFFEADTQNDCEVIDRRISGFSRCDYVLKFSPEGKVDFLEGSSEVVNLVVNGNEFPIYGSALLGGNISVSTSGSFESGIHELGDLIVGESKQVILTLENRGDLQTDTFSVVIDDTFQDFDVSTTLINSSCPIDVISLIGNSSCAFGIDISSNKEGTYSFGMTFPGVASTFRFRVRSLGKVSLSYLDNNEEVEVITPGTVWDLGSVRVGTSTERIYTLKNAGGSILTLLKNSNFNDEITYNFDNCPDTLNPNDSCQVSVNITPRSQRSEETSSFTFNYFSEGASLSSSVDFKLTALAGPASQIVFKGVPNKYAHQGRGEYLIEVDVLDSFGSSATEGLDISILTNLGTLKATDSDIEQNTLNLPLSGGKISFFWVSNLPLSNPIGGPTALIRVEAEGFTESINIEPTSKESGGTTGVIGPSQSSGEVFSVFHAGDNSNPIYFSTATLTDARGTTLSDGSILKVAASCLSPVENYVIVKNGKASFGAYPNQVECLGEVQIGTEEDIDQQNTANLGIIPISVLPPQFKNPFPISMIISPEERHVSLSPEKVDSEISTLVEIGPVRTDSGNTVSQNTNVEIYLLNGFFTGESFPGESEGTFKTDAFGKIFFEVTPKDAFVAGDITIGAVFNEKVTTKKIRIAGPQHFAPNSDNVSLYSHSISSETSLNGLSALDSSWNPLIPQDISLNTLKSFDGVFETFDHDSGAVTSMRFKLPETARFSAQKMKIDMALDVTSSNNSRRVGVFARNNSTGQWDLLTSKIIEFNSVEIFGLLSFEVSKNETLPRSYLYSDGDHSWLEIAVLPYDDVLGLILGAHTIKIDHVSVDGFW